MVIYIVMSSLRGNIGFGCVSLFVVATCRECPGAVWAR